MAVITERNGLLVFPRGEDHSAHPAVKALKSVSLGDVRFPHGFFLVEADGQWYVTPASEDDRLTRLRKGFPDLSEDLLRRLCQAASGFGSCKGDCNAPFECNYVNEPGDGWYGCVCF